MKKFKSFTLWKKRLCTHNAVKLTPCDVTLFQFRDHVADKIFPENFELTLSRNRISRDLLISNATAAACFGLLAHWAAKSKYHRHQV